MPAEAGVSSWNISIPAAVALLCGHEHDQRHACDESAHMREERDAATRCLRVTDGADTAEELDCEPIQEQKGRGDFDGRQKNEDGHQCDDPSAGEFHKICAHDACNCAAR